MMKRPNILFIMSDDHASNAISCYNSRLAKEAPTPNIDRIALEGMRFDNCHCTNSICTPSRATILTGQHSHINGVKTLADSLPDNASTILGMLQEGGYNTAIFGKWHLNCRPSGFDDWAIIPGQGLYNDPIFLYPNESDAPKEHLVKDLKDLPFYNEHERQEAAEFTTTREPGYVTNLITDKTLQWIENRDQEKPFFLCCHHKAPHDFFEYEHQFEDLFNDVHFEEPNTLFEDSETLNEISRKYGSTVSERWEPRNMVKHLMDENYPNGGPVDFSGLDFKGKAKKAYQKYMQDYLRTVKSIDVNVGRILDYLDQTGLADSTIVIYTSDQGMMLGEHDKIDKRWIFDESQRMPFLVRYPKEIPHDSVNSDIVDNVDIAPTLLDFAGIKTPKTMQGRSFRALMQGKTPSDWRQSTYYRYWMHMIHHWVPAHYGIRTDRFKLVFFYGMKLDSTGCDHPDCDAPFQPGFELYDIKNDPFETKNVYSDPTYADDLALLKKDLLDLKKLYGDTDEAYPELIELQNNYF